MNKSRIWEIDLARVIAITFMVMFHTVYDLNEFMGYNVEYLSGPWFYVGKASALLFMFVSGISSVLSKNSLKRGVQVFAMGMIVTAATYIFLREEYVRFGILHFLGVSMILSIFLRKLNNIILFCLSIVSLLLGIWLDGITAKNFLLLPFGAMYSGFVSMDYYPLFPYIGMFILGILFSKKFYCENRKSLFNKEVDLGYLNWVSSNSLKIYLLHQPILLAIVFAFKFLTK